MNFNAPGHYEIHVTVSASDLDKFKGDCTLIGVKPIILDLQDKRGDRVMQDVMTSSKHATDNPEGIAANLVNQLSAMAYDVLRVKIETDPFNENVPSRENLKTVKDNQYFESHLRIKTHSDNIYRIREICAFYDTHLSRNILKSQQDGIVTIMATMRDYGGVVEDFQTRVGIFATHLKNLKYDVDKVEVEFALRDTNNQHDKAWLQAQ